MKIVLFKEGPVAKNDKKVAYDNEVPAGKPLPWGPPGTPRPGQPKVAIRDDQDLDEVSSKGYQSLG